MTPVTRDADLGFARRGVLPFPPRQLEFDFALDFYTPTGAAGALRSLGLQLSESPTSDVLSESSLSVVVTLKFMDEDEHVTGNFNPLGGGGIPPKKNITPVSKSPESQVSQGTALLWIDPLRGGLAEGTRIFHGLGPNTHTAATIRKEVLTPPHPPPPKERYLGTGGTGPNPKKLLGIIFGPKMMILQGVRRWGMLHERPPKGGGGAIRRCA